ncbi:MAG: FeoA family protein [Nanobdellota archaeon]
MDLVKAKKGELKISSIEGGQGIRDKLYSINIRPGKSIRKIASYPMKGPVVVEVDDRKISIGRGMAEKVIV